MATCPDPRRTAEAGTSLIELVIGATIVITLLLAVSTSTATQSRLRRLTDERNLAMVACRNMLESLRNVAFAVVPTRDGVAFDVPGSNGLAGGLHAVAGDADGLPGSIRVVVDQSSGSEKLYLVTLNVDWTGVNGNQHYEIQTLIAERK